jgi:hypothetical protein
MAALAGRLGQLLKRSNLGKLWRNVGTFNGAEHGFRGHNSKLQLIPYPLTVLSVESLVNWDWLLAKQRLRLAP